MRTTFVFGAGASLHAGYPLASQMGEALLDFMCKSSNPLQQDAGWFLIDTFGKSPNIEDLITKAQDRIKFLKEVNTPDAMADRGRLGNCVGALSASLREWFRTIHTKPAPAYAEFANRLVQAGDVVITFNYDDSLDRELKQTGKWDISHGYGCPLGAVDRSSDVVLLKLHGSINWLVSIFGGARGGSTWTSSDPTSLGRFPVIHQADLEYLGYQEFSGRTYQSGGAFPCLILPGRTKQFFYDTSFGNEFTEFWDTLWSHATEAVKRSDRIVLCGYNMLPVDQRACELLLREPRKEAHILVVSGSQGARIARDFGTAGFPNVQVFKGGRFEDWVQEAQRKIVS
jgi:hypothetical protein